MVLSRKKKQLAREYAAEAWNTIGEHHPDWSWEKRRDEAKSRAAADIRADREGFGNGVSSIFVTILIGLAVRFAFYLIIKWFENQFSAVNPHADDVNE